MARDFLAVPIAGVGVERIFSLARDIVTYRRNRLKGVTIADLLIAKEYWRTYEDQALNTEEVKEEVKIREEEFDDRRWADNPDNLAISDAEDDFENSASSENSAEEETEERENARAKKRKRLGVSAHRNIVYTYGNQG
jgi:pyruvate/2-oxoacid:ferredoxin oxidoreductase beta subunit